MGAFIHVDMTADDPEVTVNRSEGHTRITIRSSRPDGTSVTVDLPLDVAITGHLRQDPPRRTWEQHQATRATKEEAHG